MAKNIKKTEMKNLVRNTVNRKPIKTSPKIIFVCIDSFNESFNFLIILIKYFIYFNPSYEKRLIFSFNLLISVRNFRGPEDYKEVFGILKEEKIITKEPG